MLLVSFIFFAILGLILFWMFSARAVPNNRPINRPAPNPKACDCSQQRFTQKPIKTVPFLNLQETILLFAACGFLIMEQAIIATLAAAKQLAIKLMTLE